MDASKIIADVAIPSTVNLLRQGRKDIVRDVLKENSKKGEKLRKKYITAEKDYDSADEEKLKWEIEESKEFIKEVDNKYSRKVQETVDVLKKVVKRLHSKHHLIQK